MAVDVILPNVVVADQFPLGALQFGWLNVLYASARNWKESRSWMGKDFASAVSKLTRPGP